MREYMPGFMDELDKLGGFFGQSVAQRMATSPMDEAEAEAPYADAASPFEGPQEQADMEDFSGRVRGGGAMGLGAGGALGAAGGYGLSRAVGAQSPWLKAGLLGGGALLGAAGGGLAGMSAGGRSALQNIAERMQISNPGLTEYMQRMHQLKQQSQGE